MSKIELRNKMKLICDIGRALHKYGTSAHRLEAILNHIAKMLGLKGNFFSTPTYLAISIDSINDAGEYEQLHQHIRVSPGEANLYKLQLVDKVATDLSEGKLSIEEAIEEIELIDGLKLKFSTVFTFFAFPLTSMALAMIFKGSATDTILSFILGSIVGLLAITKEKDQRLSDVFEFLSSFLIVIFSFVIYYEITKFNYQIVLISSLIVIIPGLGLTIAMNELATNNLVSGTARLMGTLMTFFKIAFGILVGGEIGKLFYPPLTEFSSTPLPSWSIVPALVISCMAFTIIFNAHYRDFKWILFSGVTTLGSLIIGGQYFNQILSVFLSSFIIGAASNFIAIKRNKPATVTLLPGIIFIVPGSIGMKGINLIFQNDYIAGLSGGFQSIILTITIVAGLFFANIVIPPRKQL